MGIFDDLIPQQKAGGMSKSGGMFDDLIPVRKPRVEMAPSPSVPDDVDAPAPFSMDGLGPSPRRGLSPAQLDTTDDARAQRGFGRSAYMSDGT